VHDAHRDGPNTHELLIERPNSRLTSLSAAHRRNQAKITFLWFLLPVVNCLFLSRDNPWMVDSRE
jgi:hypothetical protein